ncbi:hypothetical protein C488_10928 [Natrinema pellirubrum DSM 15624]|uniref:Bacteriorhodopsin n=1 Tax=Natrinema pellirubrum (strain DSM 15624 / CIP 106293 / JCM 10476 / NCIMB 786 / 157) TaxID=797303 RepID=L0JJN7_NATP1|nr:hypothetical protein [Natrinema pellirubrum]AGB30566.1 hypothetical protein Natpe_0641 [Natrinema pellirubrum DSM 15624]ELY74959.1 hypothetical protein C488_10928 [Natrinema pellirubrum DSM 15624]ELZ18839.1 hypothetical protein C478_00115 [Natrinema thermotolerans DSM 11552]
MVFAPISSITFDASDPATTVAIGRLFAYLAMGVAAVVLLYYAIIYVREVLAVEATTEQWYLLIGIGAAIVYAVSGVASLLLEPEWIGRFVDGAILFFFLFIALAIRAMYHDQPAAGDRSRLLPAWADYVVIAGFVAAWWGAFLAQTASTRLVVAVGWIVTSAWAVLYGVRAVRVHEGTTFAALTRHLLPAIVCVTAVVFVDLVTNHLAGYGALADAAWLVGTSLVAAFLFNTAVAIRQQGGELERMYDWTTWREQSLDDGSFE